MIESVLYLILILDLQYLTHKCFELCTVLKCTQKLEACLHSQFEVFVTLHSAVNVGIVS